MLKIIGIIFFAFLGGEAKAACITNFDKKICANFQIMSHVIIKTPLSKKQLKQKLNRPLTQLAFLQHSNLFLVKHTDPSHYAKELEKRDYIIYAQPDILQHKKKHQKKQQDTASLYRLKNSWQQTKGKGINIAIIDDGFDLQHEDLQGAKVAFEYDVEQKKLDSSPKVIQDQHGTQVAGIIFAQHNKVGINGIAPEASLIAIRQTNNLTSQTLLAFTVAKLAKADVINCSWKSPILLEPLYDVITDIARQGRNGKGTAIVFSAGNDAEEILTKTTEAAIPEVIVVGATQSYSNYGKSVDFIIPSNIKTTRNKGYASFRGTSATAPIISGLLALEIAKNKELHITGIIEKLRRRIDDNKS